MTTEWHIPGSILHAYRREELSDSQAWSVEAHLIACLPCRQAISDATEISEVSSIITQVGTNLSGSLPAQAHVRKPSRLRRFWVLLNAGPAARGAWLIAVLLALVTALGLDMMTPQDPTDWWTRDGSTLLLIAPILPLLGVALSYSQIDPAHEVVASTASGGLRLILWRTLSVLLLTVPSTAVVGLLLGDVAITSWLLPCAGLTSLTLALGSVLRLEIAAASVAIGWLVLTTAPLLADGAPLLADGAPLLLTRPLPLLWSALIVGSATILVLRRAAFQHAILPSNRS